MYVHSNKIALYIHQQQNSTVCAQQQSATKQHCVPNPPVADFVHPLIPVGQQQPLWKVFLLSVYFVAVVCLFI